MEVLVGWFDRMAWSVWTGNGARGQARHQNHADTGRRAMHGDVRVETTQGGVWL